MPTSPHDSSDPDRSDETYDDDAGEDTNDVVVAFDDIYEAISQLTFHVGEVRNEHQAQFKILNQIHLEANNAHETGKRVEESIKSLRDAINSLNGKLSVVVDYSFAIKNGGSSVMNKKKKEQTILEKILNPNYIALIAIVMLCALLLVVNGVTQFKFGKDGLEFKSDQEKVVTDKKKHPVTPTSNGWTRPSKL